jgi:hypothetical protein
MKKMLTAFSLGLLVAVLVVSLTGWTSQVKSTGSARTIQNITSTGMLYFPNPRYPVNSVHSGDSSSSRTYAHFCRYSGTGTMLVLLHSRDFPDSSDTVRVGDAAYSFSASPRGLDSCEVISLGGSLFQVEAHN